MKAVQRISNRVLRHSVIFHFAMILNVNGKRRFGKNLIFMIENAGSFFLRFRLNRQIRPCVNNAGKADDRQNQYTNQIDFNRHCPIAEYQYLHRLSACFEEKQFYKPQNCGTSFS